MRTVLGRGLIFQRVLLACTYNNDTLITLQKKKIDITHTLREREREREGETDRQTDRQRQRGW